MVANVASVAKNRPWRAMFRWGVLGFLAGCLAAPSLGTAFLWAAGGAALATLAAGTAWKNGGKWVALAGLGAICATAGWGWSWASLEALGRTERATERWASLRNVAVVARVTDAVRWSDTGATLEGELLAVDGQAAPAYGIRIYVPGNVRPRPGSILQGTGSLGRPEGTAGPGAARSFRVRDIFLSAYVASPRVTPGDPGWVDRFRTAVLDIFDNIYPAPAKSVMAGILLGDGTSLDRRTVDDFRASGLAHVLVASGSNVVIVLVALGIFARRLPFPWGAAVPAAGAVLFAALAGGGVPVTRAALMGLAATAVLGGGRKMDAANLLLATLCIFAFMEPLSLAWDPSLRLSFCATAGAMWLARPLAAWLGWIPASFGLREAAGTTLAAALATIPVAAADFGTVSLAAIPANLLAGWAVAPAMALGTAAAAFSWCAPVRDSLGFLGWVAVSWIAGVARTAATWPWATVGAGPWAAWAFAGLVPALVWWARKKSGTSPDAEKGKTKN